jgi:hypothetical protein
MRRKITRYVDIIILVSLIALTVTVGSIRSSPYRVTEHHLILSYLSKTNSNAANNPYFLVYILFRLGALLILLRIVGLLANGRASTLISLSMFITILLSICIYDRISIC